MSASKGYVSIAASHRCLTCALARLPAIWRSECLLPDFVAEQILHKFEKFFEGKNGQVKDSAALVALLQVMMLLLQGSPGGFERAVVQEPLR